MFLFRISILPAAALALSCYNCDEKTYTLCDQNKVLETCLTEQTSCFIEEQQTHGNMVRRVLSGCKQHTACVNNFNHNFPDDPLLTRYAQCFSEDKTKVSKCRQCCITDLCNELWLAGSLNTDAEWADVSEH